MDQGDVRIETAFEDFETFFDQILKERDRVSERLMEGSQIEQLMEQVIAEGVSIQSLDESIMEPMLASRQVEKFYDVYLMMVGIVLHFEKHRRDGDQHEQCHIVEFGNMLQETLEFVEVIKQESDDTRDTISEVEMFLSKKRGDTHS